MIQFILNSVICVPLYKDNPPPMKIQLLGNINVISDQSALLGNDDTQSPLVGLVSEYNSETRAEQTVYVLEYNLYFVIEWFANCKNRLMRSLFTKTMYLISKTLPRS